MIFTFVCANYIAFSLSPGLHCTTGPRSPNLLLNQVVTLAAPGIRGPPPPITGGLGPKLVSTRICWSGASKATDSATAASPRCTTALGCCHQLQSPTTTTTTTPSRPNTTASLPAHFACQPTNNLLWSLSCQEGAQLLLSRTTTTTMCTVRPSLSDWWPVGPSTSTDSRCSAQRAHTHRTHTTPATTFSNIIIIIAVLLVLLPIPPRFRA